MGDSSPGGFGLAEKQVVEALVGGSYLDEKEIKASREYATEHHISLVEALLAEEKVSKDILGQALAEYLKVEYYDLNSKPVPQEQVLKIPEKLARKLRVVLVEEGEDALTFATDNPSQSNLASELKKIFPKAAKATLAYSLTEDIDEMLLHYRKKLTTRFARIIKNADHTAPKLIEEIMSDALQLRASDVHFEPQEEEIIIRFRIDDVLQEAGRIPMQHYETVINRVKVMAHLRTDEHFSAQDGAIRYEHGDEEIDLRVSIAPVVDGEKIAIRILSRYVREYNLSNLGLAAEDQEMIRQAAHLPFGMILVSGPTGSGKSTSLYALLKVLNSPDVNITTIEDPVEYKIRGVNHIQVNQQTELTFAKGLRSIVRQDPDIILVGEIRDEETADIAVNAALTGHMLFSTFHANDAATSVPRMLDMGVEPFLLASTLELIVAQRLVRKICENCRISYTISDTELEKQLAQHERYFTKGSYTLYRGKGCNVCNHSGFKGRIAIFELIRVTPQLEELILSNPSSQEVWQLAASQGSKPMFENGVTKVKEGITTLDEVLRVAQPPTAITKRTKKAAAATK